MSDAPLLQQQQQPYARLQSPQLNETHDQQHQHQQPSGLLMKLSFLDRFLTLWIMLAAGLGLALGQLDAVHAFIGDTTVGSTNVLVAIGLIVMMYPPLTKVRWNLVMRVFANRRLLLLTTLQNWVLGPLVMFLLSAAFFHDDVGYMTGLSLVGCARCIAMVVVWNALAGGDDEYCAAIIGVNAVVTIALYAPYASLFINDLPRHVGVNGSASASVHVSLSQVATNVAVYMGVPFVLALLTWYTLTRARGTTWYFSAFTPRIGVLTLIALLFTIVVLFASQSARLTDNVAKVLYAAVPLLLYFVFMFTVSFVFSAALGATYAQTVALSFTAASNNFELALAVAVATYGLESDPALMSVVGALIEIPTMLALVHLAFWFRSTSLFAHASQQSSVDGVEAAATAAPATLDNGSGDVECGERGAGMDAKASL